MHKEGGFMLTRVALMPNPGEADLLWFKKRLSPRIEEYVNRVDRYIERSQQERSERLEEVLRHERWPVVTIRMEPRNPETTIAKSELRGELRRTLRH